MLASLFSLSLCAANIRNTKVERQYKITDGFVAVSLDITFTNFGDKATSEYVLSFDPREAAHMNTVIAVMNRKHIRNTQKSLVIKDQNGQKVVTLLSPLEPGASQTIYVGYTIGQYILFTTNGVTLKNLRVDCYFNTTIGFVSPYQTEEVSLEISGISKNSVTSMTKNLDITQKSNTISMQSIKTVPKNNELYVEYFIYKALPYVSAVNTSTHISHWGISKQESFMEVHNDGPEFVGEFNRIDFRESSNCYFQTVPVRPPADSYHFWANDESGQLQREINLEDKDLSIPLRGPVLPSWKVTYTTGWTVKTSNFVRTEGNTYIFSAPLFPKPYADRGVSVSHIRSEYVFPEGAEIKKITYPQAINGRHHFGQEVCNLDFKGRSVVVIEADRLSSIDETTVQIEYTIEGKYALYKIAYLSAGFGAIFLAIVVLRKIDLSIPSFEKKN
ncbi:Ribophorin I family protein [Trichomonas vaginalis G3]|uniref:Dolichyl-diphosphooligosaccharide--protein glycosyltransferase subunit 1 n=1 Tax=Trichomonas vaginalis (strain ATCC PRA-98 / G3) TaxID=412133 RepID=A2EL04_TRIV3|nr:dolichyl-diphosphooligosaccharide-protein glycotransferase protein [Trichomonas vaginalis G3]EAY06632.1 Ribophorin I family protein [Trichomonas vaginalis G3]KAI5552909.1 dolichyl-diphosphooligosaccharide-protein glycotransferase protein [Trichomonas vaginalis G3]|eukprot:XP_001318855.1 Ribophorin I family protein [Trichomonas vaginalis G3]